MAKISFWNLKFYPTLSSHTSCKDACFVFAIRVVECHLQNFSTFCEYTCGLHVADRKAENVLHNWCNLELSLEHVSKKAVGADLVKVTGQSHWCGAVSEGGAASWQHRHKCLARNKSLSLGRKAGYARFPFPLSQCKQWSRLWPETTLYKQSLSARSRVALHWSVDWRSPSRSNFCA